MGQEEIFVAPFLQALVIDDIFVAFAYEAESFVEGLRVRVFLRSAAIKNGCEVSPAAKPLAACNNHTSIHMDGRYVWILRMSNQRNTTGPIAWILFGSRNLFAKLR